VTFTQLMVVASMGAHLTLDAGQGVLEQELIKKEIRAHHERTWSCYERNLEPESVTDFRVALTFVISPSGHVEAAQAQSSISHPEIEACLVAEAKTWRFPRPKGGAVSVRYPFIFKADED
jgi:TonB family protein